MIESDTDDLPIKLKPSSELPIFVPLGFTFPKVWKCSLMRRNQQTHQRWNVFLGKTIIFYDGVVVTKLPIVEMGMRALTIKKASMFVLKSFVSIFLVFLFTDDKGLQLLYLTHATTTSSIITNNFNSEDFIMWPKRFLFPILKEENFPLKSFDGSKTFHVIARIKKLV